MTVAEVIAHLAAMNKVHTAFTMPGSSCLSIVDAFGAAGLHIVTTADETSAVHAAHGFASADRADRAFGCAIVARGPGAVNAMCGMVTAGDGTPVLLIAGDNDLAQRNRRVVNQDLPLERILSAAFPTFDIDSPDRLEECLPLLFEHLLDRRESCAIVVPNDVQGMDAGAVGGRLSEGRPFKFPKASESRTDDLTRILRRQRLPFLIWGRGVGLDPKLRAAAENFLVANPHINSAVTLRGLSGIPAGVRGLIGTQGHPDVNALAMASDAIIVIDEDLRAEGVGQLETFVAGRKVYSFSPSQQTQSFVPAEQRDINRSQLIDVLSSTKLDGPAGPGVSTRIPALPMLASMFAELPSATPVTLDSGQNFFWAADALILTSQRRVIFSDLQGTMGFGLPAAIGAALAIGRPVAAVLGDGALRMGMGDLATIKDLNLPVKIMVVDNLGLGMVRQSQSAKGLRPSATSSGALPLRELAGAFGFHYHNTAAAGSIHLSKLVDDRASIIHIEVPPDRTLTTRGSTKSPLPVGPPAL